MKPAMLLSNLETLKYSWKGIRMNRDDKKIENFKRDLAKLINIYSLEAVSNTPDFIIAEYLTNTLLEFDKLMQSRDNWYGYSQRPRRSE